MNFNSVIRRGVVIFGSILVLVSFQNCTKAMISTKVTDLNQLKVDAVEGDFDSLVLTEVESKAPASTESASSSPPVAVDAEDEFAYTGACSAFAQAPLALLNISSTAPDRSIVRDFGKVTIDEARRVEIDSSIGKVLVRSAESVTIKNSIQLVQVNANEVPFVRNFLGTVCVRALKVGRIDNAVTKAKIIAQEIGEISDSIAVIHVYGATVGRVSGSVAGVCLHDGAKVLDVKNSVGFVGTCTRK